MEAQETRDLLVGPFQEWCVVVDGRKLPLLTGFREGDKVWLVVDHRFCCGPFSAADAEQAARLAGEAMAVISGYPNFRAESKTMPFCPQIAEFSVPPGGSAEEVVM